MRLSVKSWRDEMCAGIVNAAQLAGNLKMVWKNPDKTFLAQAERVNILYVACADVRDAWAKGDPDARHVNLNNVCMAANASMATLRMLHWAKTGGEATMIAALGLGKPEYINFVAEDMLRASRLHLVTETQFQMEALFRNILAALGRPSGVKGFYNVAEEVLKLSELATATRLGHLNVPAMLRNSMHSNGVHHGYRGVDSIESIDGLEFCFKHGKQVSCGSWQHIVTALSRTVAIVDEILKSPTVSAIPLIPDSYAELKSAAP